MKYLLIAVGLILSSPAMSAEDTDYAAMLKDKGHTYCSKAINNVANWILDQDAGVISLWNASKPNEHAGTLLGSKRYTDGQNIMHMSATPTKDGGCDLAFTVITPVNSSCTNMRETQIKDWKYFGDITGLPVYDDPTTSNVNIVTMPVGEGCLIIKTGVLFYEKADL